MLTGKPILSGESDGHQLELIWDLCGSPTSDNMPEWRHLPGSEGQNPRQRPGNIETRFQKFGRQAISLLRELMRLDWKKRINAMDALQHPYFQTPPLPAHPRDIPTFEDSHELDRRKFQDRKAALPPAPKGGTVGRGMDGPGGPQGGFDGDGYGRSGLNGRHHPGGPDRGPRGGPLNGEERRQAAWERSRQPHALPPRPPPPVDQYSSSRDGREPLDPYRDRDRDRDRDRYARTRQPPNKDSYVPSYERGERRDPAWDRASRDGYRRYDDRDEPAWHGRDSGRDRGYEDRTRDMRRRSRSRSPIRDRGRDSEPFR
jgi:serine/threonine-protein kinase BUR1